jgi:hypothetical protein
MLLQKTKGGMNMELTQEMYGNTATLLFAVSIAWTIACGINQAFNPVWAIAGFGAGLYFMVQRNYLLLTGRR